MVDVNQGLSYTVSDKIKSINDALFNPADGLPAVSLSVGVAFTDRENPSQSIFKDADQALYQVKQARLWILLKSGCPGWRMRCSHGGAPFAGRCWARMPCREPYAWPACPKKCGCSTSHHACRKGSTAFMP